jgi:hypothetical protein
MKRLIAAVLAFAWLSATGVAIGQQRPADAPPIVDGKKVSMIWTLGDQIWEFKDTLSVYEPVKATFDPLTRKAVWMLELVKDLDAGTVALHQETRGTPFKPVLLNADRTVIPADAVVEITTISGKMGDTVSMTVQLPDKETLATVKLIRVELRTKVGF